MKEYIHKKISSFWREESGQSLMEYMFLLVIAYLLFTLLKGRLMGIVKNLLGGLETKSEGVWEIP